MTVDLIEVDVVGLQAPQRVLASTNDVEPAVAVIVGTGQAGVVHRVSRTAAAVIDFGRDQDLVAPSAAGQGTADNLLAFAVGVGVSGVDEVDTGIERPVENASRIVLGGGIGKIVGAQAQAGDPDCRFVPVPGIPCLLSRSQDVGLGEGPAAALRMLALGCSAVAPKDVALRLHIGTRPPPLTLPALEKLATVMEYLHTVYDREHGRIGGRCRSW